MERTTSIAEAKQVLCTNFIGPDELVLIANKMGIEVPSEIPRIPFSPDELKNKKEDYFLILGATQMKNGEPITLRTLRDRFGFNPDVSEPCFYNQDWYLKEDFIEKPLESNWFLVRKNVVQESRGKDPEHIKNQYTFPAAVRCAYSFFACWFYAKECLWKHDFVWCNDIDTNGDRIYVGRYFDPTGGSKNGFSIHRHLKLRPCYGSVDCF